MNPQHAKYAIIGLIIFVNWFSGRILSQTLVGTDGYIEYSVGTLPIIISVPHGGNITPTFIPNRTCNNAVTVTDANTIDLANKINQAFEVKTGCRPHVIYCHLRRTKLDANRNISDGTCGNPIAIAAWKEFHQFIDTARFLTVKKYNNKSFYFDIHGHGHDIQQLELGYLLSDDELELKDQDLNDQKYISISSIQNLVKNNSKNLTHAQLLRGPMSLGSMFVKRSFPAVPSQQIPSPGPGNPYFSGGYNTANHTCGNPNIEMNGVQIECNFQNVRDNEQSRLAFADAFTDAVIEYMLEHFDLDLKSCRIVDISDINSEKKPIIYPSIASANQWITAFNIPQNIIAEWYDGQGRKLSQGQFVENMVQVPDGFTEGIYFLKLTENNRLSTHKIIVID